MPTAAMVHDPRTPREARSRYRCDRSGRIQAAGGAFAWLASVLQALAENREGTLLGKMRHAPAADESATRGPTSSSTVTMEPENRARRTFPTFPHSYGANLSTGEGGEDYHLHSPAAAFCFAVV